ncbi:dockerin type I domain-containing protein [bacterium]|nr:dockerin type I domain-containing protein [bacterium]MDB4633094.1 dockerin type I domain-containing protein [bacterium]
MNCMYRTLLAAVALAFSSVTASAETITVCASGCDYTSINAAIAVASDGDVIQLAAETYFEGEQIDTLGKAITLRGVLDKAGEPASVLDAAESHRVLICESGEGPETIFENLVIRNGYLPGFGTLGGGVRVVDSDPSFLKCDFKNNQAWYCGGITMSGSSSSIVRCSFENNSGEQGGGALSEDGSPSFIDCVFIDNAAANGGGLWIDGGSPTVVGCSFFGNSASNLGGVLYIRQCCSDTDASLVDCHFLGNSARLGGAAYVLENSPSFEQCRFESNVAADQGGGMHNRTSSPTLTDCTFTSNEADQGGGIFNVASSFPILSASSVCDNAPDQIAGSWGDGGGNCIANSCNACCPGDLDQNGEVDASDLGLLIAAWNTDGSIVEGSDINGDGVVSAADLGLLIGAWGPCR